MDSGLVAKKLDDLVIVDGLNIDIPSRAHFETMLRGGVTAFHTTVAALLNFRETMDQLTSWYGLEYKNADLLLEVNHAADIARCKAEGKLGVILGFQDAQSFEDDLRLIEVFYRLGIRISQITYSLKNFIGDGCWEPNDGGLSRFGVSVVHEMNAVGMLVDLSHSGPRTTLDAIAASRRPCAFTHVGAKSLVDNARNKTDDELKAVAAGGGVIGVTVVPRFVANHRPARMEDILRHIEYIANLVGIEHVAIGTDRGEGRTTASRESMLRPPARFLAIRSAPDESELVSGYYARGPQVFERLDLDEFTAYAPEFESMSQFADVAGFLLKEGYSEPEVRGIMGENWVRLYESVWR